MTVRLHLFVDERGLARTLVDLWIPHLDADAAWIVGPSDRSLDPELAREVVPILTLDPLEVAAVIAEQSASEQRVLAVFSSLDALQDAALGGLHAEEVTLLHVGSTDEGQRVAADIHIDDSRMAALSYLEKRGFTFTVQPIPNVTPRPWSVDELRS